MSYESTMPLIGKDLLEKKDSSKKTEFDPKQIYDYPNSEKKLQMIVARVDMKQNTKYSSEKVHSTFISPFGIEFKGSPEIQVGMLLKAQIIIPDYWSRMQRMVEYKRINTPEDFRVLIRVVETKRFGVRSRKRIVVSKVVNIDPMDKRVLSEYLIGVKK